MKRLRVFVVTGALLAFGALPGVVQAGGPFSSGMALTLRSVKVVANAGIVVNVDIVCGAIAGNTVLSLENSPVVVAQASHGQVVHAQGNLGMGPITCDGTTVSHWSFSGISDGVPFHTGALAIEVSAYILDFNTNQSDRADTGLIAFNATAGNGTPVADGMTLTLTSAKLVARVGVNVGVDVTCNPINGESALSLEDNSIIVAQAVNGKIARASGFMSQQGGPFVCDGHTVNHFIASLLSDTVPFAPASAAIRVVGRAIVINGPCCASDRGDTGLRSFKLTK